MGHVPSHETLQLEAGESIQNQVVVASERTRYFLVGGSESGQRIVSYNELQGTVSTTNQSWRSLVHRAQQDRPSEALLSQPSTPQG
jgi:hypothetical protein